MKASKETIKFRIKEANEYFKYFTFPKGSNILKKLKNKNEC